MRPLKLVASVLVALSLLAAGCGEDEPELTIEQRLAGVEGRELTDTEVADKLATAGILCQLDDQVLDAIWRQLNERQLNYQDVVFGHICPDRSIFYAGLTGRYVTDEAVESGVVTSTSKPAATTTLDATTLDPSTTLGTGGSNGLTTQTTGSDGATTAPRATIGPAPSTEGSSSQDSTATSSALTLVPTTTSTALEGEGG